MAWQRLATRTGGTVSQLALAKGADGVPLIFAATSVGVHCSSDGGRTWAPTGTLNNVPLGEAVAASPGFAHDRTILVGMRDGLHRSSDGGESWQLVLTGCRTLSLACAPDEAGSSLLLAGTETDGILRSEDAGQTWASANPGLLDLTVLALALSARFERDHVGFAGTASGLYRTRNGARSWREAATGLDEPAVQCLAISPTFADDRLVLAGTEAHGLLRSDDGGTSWEIVSSLEAAAITALAFSTGKGPRRLIAAATDEGVAISDDGGRAWRLTGRALGPALSLLFVPTDAGETILAGLPEQGVARSADQGATWALANDGLGASLLAGLVISPGFDRDRTLFATGLQEGILVSLDGGRTWTERNNGLEQPTVFGLALSPDFGCDRTLYAAAPTGLYRSRDGGTMWHSSAAGGRRPASRDRDGAPAAGVCRAVATGAGRGDSPPMVLAAFAGGRLLASDDGGESWRVLREAFDGAEVISLALSPEHGRSQTIVVGTSQAASEGGNEVVLWRSVDGGERWERWLVERGAGLLPLAVPPDAAAGELLFVGLGGRVLTPIPRSTELRSGERRPLWRQVAIGRGAATVTALAASPAYRADRTLFAATSVGVFVSRDAGEHFQPWSEGLAPRSVVALAIASRQDGSRLVFALGLGGTIWQRRDE